MHGDLFCLSLCCNIIIKFRLEISILSIDFINTFILYNNNINIDIEGVVVNIIIIF